MGQVEAAFPIFFAKINSMRKSMVIKKLQWFEERPYFTFKFNCVDLKVLFFIKSFGYAVGIAEF